jgi:two-component sensor histidine kinase
MKQSDLRILVAIGRAERQSTIASLIKKSIHPKLHATYVNSLDSAMSQLEKSPFDAILLELDLPDSRGMETLSKIQEKAPRMAIIVLADNIDEDTMDVASSIGAQNFLVLGHYDDFSLSKIVLCSIEKKNMEEMNKTLKVVNSILRHDILNNFTVISGSLEIYKMKKDEKFLNSAMNGVERSIDLIKRMKEVEKVISPNEMKRVNVRTLVDEVINKYPQDKIHFTVEGGGIAFADDALISVFENIINNAIIHSGTDVVKITIQPSPTDTGLVEIRFADQGVGIPKEIRSKIFQEGFRYGKSGQSGLGLYIVKKVLERYGASISVEDNEPKGSVFVIVIKSS